MDQATAASAAAPEVDPEIQQLEQECYAALLECCKKMAAEAGVNYTSIMNLQVRRVHFQLKESSYSYFKIHLRF